MRKCPHTGSCTHTDSNLSAALNVPCSGPSFCIALMDVDALRRWKAGDLENPAFRGSFVRLMNPPGVNRTGDIALIIPLGFVHLRAAWGIPSWSSAGFGVEEPKPCLHSKVFTMPGSSTLRQTALLCTGCFLNCKQPSCMVTALISAQLISLSEALHGRGHPAPKSGGAT